MKLSLTLPFSVAVLSLAVLAPTLARAQTTTHLVPARAALSQALVASKLKPGDEFRATLSEKVQLQNGPKLPAGTVLLGQIAIDDTNQSGTSKLVLRFTSARLKNGQTVPIKATIVGIAAPHDDTIEATPVNAGDQVSKSWNDGTLVVDQVEAVSGVDLHSRITSTNSGVFVSTKDNVKLKSGSEFVLAIAEQQPTQQTTGTNGNQ